MEEMETVDSGRSSILSDPAESSHTTAAALFQIIYWPWLLGCTHGGLGTVRVQLHKLQVISDFPGRMLVEM